MTVSKEIPEWATRQGIFDGNRVFYGKSPRSNKHCWHLDHGEGTFSPLSISGDHDVRYIQNTIQLKPAPTKVETPEWATSEAQLNGKRVFFGKPPYGQIPGLWYCVADNGKPNPLRDFETMKINGIQHVVRMKPAPRSPVPVRASAYVHDLAGIAVHRSRIHDEIQVELIGSGQLRIYDDFSADYVVDQDDTVPSWYSGDPLQFDSAPLKTSDEAVPVVDLAKKTAALGAAYDLSKKLDANGIFGVLTPGDDKSAQPTISIARMHGYPPCSRRLALDVEGYESLAQVLAEAYEQAAVGKGHQRHANDKPFEEQSTQGICDMLDSADGMAHQAIKKILESRRLGHAARSKELKGAIVYLAGMIIWLENNRCEKPPIPKS